MIQERVLVRFICINGILPQMCATQVSTFCLRIALVLQQSNLTTSTYNVNMWGWQCLSRCPSNQWRMLKSLDPCTGFLSFRSTSVRGLLYYLEVPAKSVPCGINNALPYWFFILPNFSSPHSYFCLLVPPHDNLPLSKSQLMLCFQWNAW